MPKILLSFALMGTILFTTGCAKDNPLLPATPPVEIDALDNSSSTDDASAMKKGSPSPGDMSIASIAINNGFTELVGALSYVDDSLNAGLVDLFLNGTDQYTVFAPTDAAFNTLYANLGINGISDLPPSLVLDVLLYHVVEGRRAANSVVPKNGERTITTLLGVEFSVTPGLQINAIGNTANIDPNLNNLSASNGIIHVIDAVILPIQ